MLGIPDALLHTVSFVVALGLVVLLHVLLGEMVPKNIAIAGPERTAMLLTPAYLLYMRAVRPFIAFYNWCANITLRALRVEPKDELDITVSTVELSEMIAESVSEGLLDPEEHTRLTRALQIRNRVVADVAVPLGDIRAVHAVLAGAGPTVGRRRAGADADRLLAASRSPAPTVRSPGTCTSRTCWRSATTPDAVIDATRCARCRRWRRRCRCPTRCPGCAAATATWPWSPTPPAGRAMVALEDLVEDLVGTVRDGTAPCRDWRDRAAACRRTGRAAAAAPASASDA